MNKIISLTTAQYRMLGRAIRGEKLPVANFHGPTASALARKGCWRHHGAYWAYTDLGKRVHASRGLWLIGRKGDEPSCDWFPRRLAEKEASSC
jgi:hypothetical protein